MSDMQKNNICKELRQLRKKDMSYKEIDEKYTQLTLIEIISCVIGLCECDVTEESIDARDDEPWKEQYVLEKLYFDYDLRRFNEMSKVMDCHSETAKKYVDYFGISPINSSDRTSSPRVNDLLRLGAEKNGNIEIK